MSESVAHIDEPVVAICINGSYEDERNNRNIYKCTRGTWKVSRGRADKAHHALAVYHGTILEVYEIYEWFDAGATPNSFGPAPGRYEFVGRIAQDEIRDKYVAKLLPDRFYGNPIRYYNC
jgi:hypothetical protein